jgi:hypothetical protein
MWVAALHHRPDVDALVRELTPDQMAEWVAFIELYGLTPDAADFRFARLAMILSQGKIAVRDLLHKPTWEIARAKSVELVISQWEAFNVRRAARKRK